MKNMIKNVLLRKDYIFAFTVGSFTGLIENQFIGFSIMIIIFVMYHLSE